MEFKINVRISFVIPDGFTKESDNMVHMVEAFEVCKQNSMDVNWISSEDNLNVEDLQKNDFIVFQSFQGELFEKVTNTRSVIVGALCLLSCITEDRAIPNLSWPILNIAMVGCYVTCSHLPKLLKDDIKNKVCSMGGHYIDSVFQVNTHLVTNSVKSEKYLKAAMNDVKIMLPSWIDAVWEENLKSSVHCNDTKFEKYKCLPFYNLTICTTGFTIIEDRKKIQHLIEENGGIYSGQMNVNQTDILVCKGNASSEKFKAARKSKTVKCVTFEWIIDSIEKRYSLPDTDYVVQRETSTPTKTDEFLNPNFSMLSAIGNSTHLSIGRSILQETNLPPETESKKRKSSSTEEVNETVNNIDLKRVKTAGSFLDGCSIYLAGFELEQKEKLCKILNFSGATRYENLSDRLTHIIVGDVFCNEMKVIRSTVYQVPIITVKWLHACIEQEKIVSEEAFLISNKCPPPKDCGSPLSKKGLQLLRSNASNISVANIELENNTITEEDVNEDILSQYLKPNSTDQDDTLALLLKDGTNPFDTKTDTKKMIESKNTIVTDNHQIPSYTTTSTTNYSMTSTEETTTNLLFQGLSFLILNFDDEAEYELKDIITPLGGEIVPKSYKGIPNYTVVPIFNTETLHTTSEIVTDFWITDCCQDNELKKVEYFYKPLTVQQNNVLENCVVTISGYTGKERDFLRELIKELGGICQEQLSRIKKNDILASTHLLSSVASGNKYVAAIRWGRPIISKKWLLECAKLGKLVPEEDFLVGDSKVPEQVCEKSVEQTAQIPKKVNSDTSKTSRKALTANSSNLDNTLENNTTVTNYNPPIFHVNTPTTSKNVHDRSKIEQTPKNQFMSPEVCSQVTPVNKIMNQVRTNYMLGTPPSTPPLPRRYGDIDTPETPYGAFIRPNPTPNLRKETLKWINSFPEKTRRDSTPLSELKRRLWNKICPPDKPGQPNFDSSSEHNETVCEDALPATENNTPENVMIKSKLLQFQASFKQVSASGGNRKSVKMRESIAPVEATLKDSQACTVEWDYAECNKEIQNSETKPCFMISGVSVQEREELMTQLSSLGATVSSDSNNYDSASTHLISTRPSRNEKMLSSMASGKWILHPDFIKKSIEIGKLADEEEFEYGNPMFSKDIKMQIEADTETRINAIYWWRKEITKRGYGAFHDMRAIVVSNKRECIVRVIEAGGGMVIDAAPPFNDEIYATHCLLDPKYVPNMHDYIPLAEQGIYLFNTLYINDFLHRTVKDVKECVLPVFRKYYNL